MRRQMEKRRKLMTGIEETLELAFCSVANPGKIVCDIKNLKKQPRGFTLL
jgi:hypothetical protein